MGQASDVDHRIQDKVQQYGNSAMRPQQHLSDFGLHCGENHAIQECFRAFLV
jgi:hypothetical protein